MTWTTQPYCTLTDVKLLLDPNMSNADDTFISGLIIQAQADIDSELGFSFQQDGTVSTPAQRVYDGKGEQYLEINELVALSSTVSGAVIEIARPTYLQGGVTWVAGTITQIDITADIIVLPNNYQAMGVPATLLALFSGTDFTLGRQNYIVNGIFGKPYLSWQTYPGVPNDISRATARLAVHYYKMRDAAYADMVNAAGGVREKYSKSWPDDVKRVIAKYQHHKFLTGTHDIWWWG